MKNFVLSKETKLLAYKINNGIFSPYLFPSFIDSSGETVFFLYHDVLLSTIQQ